MIRSLFWKLFLLALAFQMAAHAQNVTTLLKTGELPSALAINPVTNTLYIANSKANTITVYGNGQFSDLTVGANPIAIAVNPVTNKIYVANHDDGTVSAVDGVTGSSVTIPTGTGPMALAINPGTNKIYVVNSGQNTLQSNLSVIDGVTNKTTNIAVGFYPTCVAVNPVTNQIYVGNQGGQTITVVDGISNGTSTINTFGGPTAIAVNPITNKIYVANNSNSISNSVIVIDGFTNKTTSLPGGSSPLSVVVDSITNQVYVSNFASNTVTVIRGADNGFSTISMPAGFYPEQLALNEATGQVYATGNGGMEVIAESSNIAQLIPGVGAATAIAINPVTNKIYAIDNNGTNTVVVDGGTIDYASESKIPLPSTPTVLAVNPVTNKSYVVYSDADANLAIINGVTNQQTIIPLARNVYDDSIVINQITNKIYISCASQNSIYVIDGATDALSQTIITSTAPNKLALNPVTNQIYATNPLDSNGSITIIDGNTNNSTRLSFGGGSTSLFVAVNPATNKIYVETQISLVIIDGATNNIMSLPMANATAGGIAINPVTNKIYVGSSNGVVTVVDGVTNAMTNVSTYSPAPQFLQVNTVTNKIYVGGNLQNATIIDGLNNSISTLAGPYGPFGLNQVDDRLYGGVADYRGESYLTEFDVLRNFSDPPSVFIGYISGIDVNPLTKQIYVADLSNDSLDIFNELQVQINPLTTSITPLSGNQTSSPTPQFSFTTASTSGTTPTNVYFQVDTTQGTWTASYGSSPTFSGTVARLLPGIHTLFAYSVDAQFSCQPNSPFTGTITSYTFLVTQPAAIVPPPNSSSAFITVQALGALRNNYSGFVGFEFSTGASPIQVSSLGRFVAPGNSGTHLLKLVQANGTDLPGGFASLTINSASGQYQYATLTSPVTLSANTTFYLVSQESAGGDSWYDIGTVTATSIATILAPSYTDAAGNYIPVAGLPGRSYVPVNFLFGTTSSAPPDNTASFVTAETPGPLRNNYSGSVGFAFTPSQPVTVTALGRYAAPGNSQSHNLQLVSVDASGNAKAVASVSVSLSASTPGQFSYRALTNSVTLQANVTYYLLSEEVAGGDSWYDIGSIVTSIGTLSAPVYTDGGGHYLPVPGYAGQGYVPLSFLYSGTAQTAPPATNNYLITAQSPGALRNNYSGFVGTAIQVGATPITVTSLGRLCINGNTGTHTLKIVQANGLDLPGATVALSLAGGTPGQYSYAALASAVTLQSNATYYLVSQETAGADYWYDLEPVTSTPAAQVLGATYSDGQGNYVLVTGLPNYSYVPVNIQYQ